MSNWNPLYPSDEDVNALEEAAREAEWEDDMKRTERERKKRLGLLDEDDDLNDLF